MSQRVALFDVAGTLVSGNPWRGMLKYPKMSRWRLMVLYPLILPPWWAKKLKLLPDTRFRQIWIRQMAWLLGGMTRDEVREAFDWIVSEHLKDHRQESVIAQLDMHKQQGDRVILISGMFTEFTQAFVDALGADGAVGTVLGFTDENVCTGFIVGEGCAGHLKPIFLQQYLDANNLSLDGAEVFSYTDSFSDVPLLELAHHATVTYPEEQLASFAELRGWNKIE